MDGSIVQGIFAIADAQETCRLFEGFGAKFWDFEQGFAIAKGPILVAVGHDVIGDGGGNARHIGEQCRRGCIQIHSHIVDAAFHCFFELLLQPLLIHIMLVLPHADRFWVDLH